MLTKDMMFTIMTMVGAGVTACLAIFIFCFIRRRSCDTSYVSANEDLDLSSSHDNSVGDIADQTEAKNKDDTYFKRWASRWHRSTDKTKKIIRHVFSLKPDDSPGEEGNGEENFQQQDRQVSPECVAVPARMVAKLGPKELELGTFSGDSALQYRQIYRASRLSSKERNVQQAPGSPPHYQHSGVLRDKPMVHYFNPTCCVDGQPTSPYFDDDVTRKGQNQVQQLHQQRRGGSDVSALSSPTVTAGSGELNPLQQHHHNHSRQSSVCNDIFTIYEDNSVLSADSLDSSPQRRDDKEPQTDLDRILSSTSPVLKKGAYSGYIRERSFSPTKFFV